MVEEVPVLKHGHRFRNITVAVLVFACLGAVTLLYLRAAVHKRRLEENQRIVARVAEELGLEPGLLLAVAWAESGFDDRAVSNKGAVGLMQVMPRTGRAVGGRMGRGDWDFKERYDNAVIGATYLKDQLRRYRGDLYLALAAYHAGPDVVDAWNKQGKGLPGPEVIEQFGYDSTRQYVQRVLRKHEEYHAVTVAGRRNKGQEGSQTSSTEENSQTDKTAEPASSPSPAEIRYGYTVKAGETLSRIAEGAGVSLEQIVLLNGITDPERVQPGDMLVLRPFTVNMAGENTDLLKSIDASDVEVLVFKAERSLELRISEACIKTYRIALGKNPTGDKEVEGDGRTPEGEFYVCQKEPDGKYGPSLGFSYPNKEDAERGLRSGLISEEQSQDIVKRISAHARPPWDTKLGGAICIHGKGNEEDWTSGCIALSDDDTSEVFALIPMGAAVKIFASRDETRK